MNKLFTRIFLLVILAFGFVPEANSKVEIGSTSYNTLTDAFSAINNGTHTGSIVAKITDNISETARAVLMASGQGNASYNSIVIYPTGDYKISGNQATALIELRGADNVTFDGRKNQSGSDRNLTIENTSTSTHSVIWLDSNTTGGGGASKNTIRNVNIIGGSTTAGYGIVLSVSTSLTGAGGGNDDNTIMFCDFKKLLFGIRAYGVSSTVPVKNLKVNNNNFGSSSASETVTSYGIFTYFTDNLALHNNVFKDMVYTSAIYCIYHYYGNKDQIYNNTLDNFRSTGSVVYGIMSYYGNENKIYNNSLTNFVATVSACYPVYCLSSPYTEFYNNKVENMISGTSVVYGFYISSGNYTKVNNNTFKNFQALSSAVYGVFLSSAQYSEVNNNVLDNHISGSTTYPIYLSSCQYSKVNNNRLTNIFLSSASNNFIYGIGIFSSPYTESLNNYIDNMINNTLSTNAGIYVSSSQYAKINNNRISRLVSQQLSYGIFFTTVADAQVNGNEIFDMTANGTSTTGAWGIFITGTSSNTEIINNTIAYVRTTQSSASSTTNNPFGIAISGGTGYKIWYNSVQLSGKQIATGTQGTLSACLMISSTAVNTFNLRNNNFSNTLEGLSGSNSYAIYLAGTGNLTNSTMDYNNYYVGGPHGMLGFLTSNRNSISDWRTATSREQNSMSILVQFNSHLNNSPIPGSQIIGKGTPISDVIYDILGEQRSNTTPTPGAYEKAADILGPDIVFDKLTITSSTANRVITARITDYTGVNKTNSAPRLYYRATKNSNAWVGNNSNQDGWKFATATISGDQYTFTLDYNRLNGGMVVGDVIEYFIIAQDIAPKQNISVSRGFFSVTPTSTDLNAQNFPFYDADSYRTAHPIKGEIKVGSGQDYATLTDDGGLFEYMNKNIITGEVNVLITRDLTETGKHQLRNMSYENGNFHYINIRPSEAKTKKITGAIAGSAVIWFLGANYVNLDGSFEGAGRYLEISNTQTSGVYACVAVGSGAPMVNGGKFITIQNCVIFSGYITSTNGSFGILVTDGVMGQSGTSPFVHNLTIRNNHIYKSTAGIWARATSTGMFENLLIENNIIGNANAGDGISWKGIDLAWANTATIRRNTIHSFATNLSTVNYAGIETNNTNNFVTIDGNQIYNIKQPSASGYGAYGINVAGSSTTVGFTITNNFIAEISTMNYSRTSTTWNPFGIRIASGQFHKIWHNTIIMTGQQGTSGSQPSLTANIIFTSTFYFNDLRNNILHNSLQGLSGTLSFNVFTAMTSNLWTNMLSTADYNNYTVGGSAGVFGGWGTSIPYNQATSLTAWKNMTGRDLNSFSTSTQHISTTDLHLNGGSVGNTAIMIPRMSQVMIDGDGEARPNPTYVGADEVVPFLDLTRQTTFTPQNNTYCINGNVNVSFDFDLRFGDGVQRSGLSAIDITWYKNGSVISGAKNKSINFEQLKMSDSARYYATVNFLNLNLVTQERNLKVEAPIVINLQPKDADICSSDPILQLTTASQGTITGYQWEFRKTGTQAWMPLAGHNTPNITKYLDDPDDAVGSYRLKIIGPGNCGSDVIYSNVINVNVSDPLHSTQLQYEGNLGYVCRDETIIISAIGEGTIFGYRWQKNIGKGFIDLSVNDYPSAHTNTLILTNATPDESAVYRCMIQGSAVCNTALVPTPAVNVRVWDFFAIEEHPESQVVCHNDNLFLRVFAEGTIYGYQWTKNGVDITLDENPFAQSAVLYLNNADYSISGVYTCRLHIEDCSGEKYVTTNPAAVYVATSTEILIKPQTQSVMVGNSVHFNIRAHVNGAPPTFNPRVQWYRGNQPLLESPKYIGTKSNNLIISNVNNNDFGSDYWVVVFGLCGNDTVRNFGLVKAEFAITKQPDDISVCQNGDVTFGVETYSSIGENMTYQWYRNGTALRDNGDYFGTRTSTLVINGATSKHNGEYHCKVKTPSSEYGLNTRTAKLVVRDVPVITSNLKESLSLTIGDELRLEVQAEGTDLQYQWYFNEAIIPDATEATLAIEEIAEEDAGKYHVTVRNECGLVTSISCEVVVASGTTDVTKVIHHGYSLGVAVPNPVNSSTVMPYSLPTDGYVGIVLINQLGIEVAKLVETKLASGDYKLSIDAHALRLTSGIYSVILRANGVQLIQRLAVIK